MDRFPACIGRRAGALIIAAMLLCGLGASNAGAQMFQAVYGGGVGGGESGRGGVTAVSTGGYIAAGESYSASGANSDIYVVRTDNAAVLVWSSTYSIGQNDSATDIIECANGDFVVVGVTDNINSGCATSRDIFLLRLDKCGRVIWVDTYGHPSSDEIGWEVIEAASGDPAFGTAAGDLIVAGSTTFMAPGSGRDGFLLRAKAGGGWIWDRSYDDVALDDYFYALVEARFNNNNIAGDIVAVGGSDVGGGNIEGFMVRVDGNTGFIGAPPQNASVYVGRKVEEFRSVCEMRVGPVLGIGNLVAVGNTTSLSPLGAPDVLLVEYNGGNPCKLNSDLTIGDGGQAGPDEGYSVREDALSGAGRVIVTGYVTLAGGLGGNDAFLHTVTTTPLTPVVPAGVPWVYGGVGTDWGWSATSVTANFPCQSPGYVLAGFTTTFTGGANQLYLVKTNGGGKSGCNEASPAAKYPRPNFTLKCIPILTNQIGLECIPVIRSFCQQWQRVLCYGADGTAPGVCPGPICPICPPAIPPKSLADPTDDAMTGSMIASYPNPVRRGSALSLRYTAPREGDVTVTISDIAGRLVYVRSTHYVAGAPLVPLGTEGLAAGTYIVGITAGDTTVSGRVEVIGR